MDNHNHKPKESQKQRQKQTIKKQKDFKNYILQKQAGINTQKTNAVNANLKQKDESQQKNTKHKRDLINNNNNKVENGDLIINENFNEIRNPKQQDKQQQLESHFQGHELQSIKSSDDQHQNQNQNQSQNQNQNESQDSSANRNKSKKLLYQIPPVKQKRQNKNYKLNEKYNSDQLLNSEQEQDKTSPQQYQKKQNQNQNQQKEELSNQFQFQIPPLQQKSSNNINSSIKSTINSLKQMKTNFAYNIKHSSLGLISSILSNRKKVVLQENAINKNKKVNLLGNRFQVCYHQQREAFLMKFSNVIWFSYRSNIYGVDTDAGWGCMIRVCQMVLAQTFQSFYKSCKQIRSMTVSKLSSKQKSLKQIIEYFMDNPQAYFSLTRICQRGNIKQRWTSSIQIFTIMKQILKQFNFELNIQVFSGGIQVQNLQELNKQQYPVLIAVSNRVGVKGIPQHYQRHLLQLMNNEYFVGCVGGISGEALYLIGHYEGRVIFLDPHYVQSTDSQQYNTSSYFQSQPYSIGISNLSPSIAVCYYVRNKEQYEELLKILYQVQLQFYPNVCLQICCQQVKNQVISNSKLQTIRKNSGFSDDQFQVL